MPDLHGWISQKIAATEARARACPPSPQPVDSTSDYVGGEIRDATGRVRATGLFVTPATVLRRCEADRKILAIHRPKGPGSWEPYACEGCGSDDMGALVDHANDCETLQALAEGYGFTDDDRARLDRPERPRPVSLHKTHADWLAAQLRRIDETCRPTIPTSAVPAALRGPNWKART